MTDRTIMKLEFVERTNDETGNITWVVLSEPYYPSQLPVGDVGPLMYLLTQMVALIGGQRPIYTERLIMR